MKAYEHIFFDLDNTLVDIDSNSKETLTEIHRKFSLKGMGVPLKDFWPVFFETNDQLWFDYRQGTVTKDELRETRFVKTLARFGVDDQSLADAVNHDFIKYGPTKTNLYPGTHEILTYLKDKGYQMHLITNGFKEVQYIKIKNSKLAPYFNKVVVSDEVGSLKPRPEMFQAALDMAGATKENSLMVGDDLISDIQGASRFGMDVIFFNPMFKSAAHNAIHEIHELLELKKYV